MPRFSNHCFPGMTLSFFVIPSESQQEIRGSEADLSGLAVEGSAVPGTTPGNPE
jgi:hypothetical protein